jgi:radical SAM protein with 4Fe4S-binding SPASM domain
MAAERGSDFRLDPALFPCRDGHRGPLDHRIPPEEAVAIEKEDRKLYEKAAAYFEKVRDLPPPERLYSCMAGVTAFHVDPVGTLLPCLMVTSHGFDLRRGSFLAGWREVIPRFREQTVTSEFECHRCETRVVCGACPAMFSMETGSAQRKTEYICRLGRERHRAILDVNDSTAGGVILRT